MVAHPFNFVKQIGSRGFRSNSILWSKTSWDDQTIIWLFHVVHRPVWWAILKLNCPVSTNLYIRPHAKWFGFVMFIKLLIFIYKILYILYIFKIYIIYLGVIFLYIWDHSSFSDIWTSQRLANQSHALSLNLLKLWELNCFHTALTYELT